MNDHPNNGHPFPLSYHSLIWIAVACLLLFKTGSDIAFHTQKEAVQIRTISEARSVEPNSLVDVHLPLDLEKGIVVESELGGDSYSIVPFAGTGFRLLYAEPGIIDEGASPPFSGRAAAKDFADDWSVSSSDDAKLHELFDDEVPEDAILVRRADGEGINLWQWFTSIGAGIYLVWKVISVIRWFSGDDAPESPKPRDEADDQEWD